jgi:prenyltransferase beta subunit
MVIFHTKQSLSYRRTSIILGLFITVTLASVVTGLGAAKSRQDLLVTFLKWNQVSSGGFKDSNVSSPIVVNPFTCYANIYLLQQMGKLDSINDKIQAQNFLKGQFTSAVSEENLPNIYFSFKSIKILGDTAEANTTTEGGQVMMSLHNNNTFGFRNFEDPTETILATYYAIEYLSESASAFYSAENETIFVMSCWDSTVGAFAGAPGGEGNVIDSYYALKILQRCQTLGSLNATYSNALKAFFASYYVANPDFKMHYGGYSYRTTVPFSTIILTSYSVGGLKLLGGSLHVAETRDFILNRQSSIDYGFQEMGENQNDKYSSAISSYYAIETLINLDSDKWKDWLKEDLYKLEINPWAIVGIVAGSITGVVLICFGIWKYKNRM